MPIVDVELVRAMGASGRSTHLSRRLADVIGKVLGSPTGGTWVRLRLLNPGDYAENGTSDADTPAPAFVTVLARARPQGNELAWQVDGLTSAVAEVVGVPEDLVHVIFLESGTGRVAFGGRIV